MIHELSHNFYNLNFNLKQLTEISTPIYLPKNSITLFGYGLMRESPLSRQQNTVDVRESLNCRPWNLSQIAVFLFIK